MILLENSGWVGPRGGCHSIHLCGILGSMAFLVAPGVCGASSQLLISVGSNPSTPKLFVGFRVKLRSPI